MAAHVRLITKKREKPANVNNLIVESDDEFTANINAIETQVANEIELNLPEQSSQINFIIKIFKVFSSPKKKFGTIHSKKND